MHECTDEDYDRFFPPYERDESRLKKFKKNGGLYCIDWDAQDIDIFGYQSSGTYSLFDVMAIPCHTNETLWGAPEARIRDDCIWDRDEAMKYMETINIVALYNEGHFLQDEISDDRRIEYRSTFRQLRADVSKPHWFPTFIHTTELQDEVKLIQYGAQEELFFDSVFFESSNPSFLKDWPTKENPDTFIKYTSMAIMFDQNMTVIERSTYSLLELLGDVGGLIDGLRYIGIIILSPFMIFKLD